MNDDACFNLSSYNLPTVHEHNIFHKKKTYDK